jgi:hypothetical protein
MITDTDLLHMYRTPENYSVTTATLDDELLGIIIYRNEPINNRIEGQSIETFLTNLNIDITYPWIGTKIITISFGLELINDTDDLIKLFIKNLISHIVSMNYPEPNQFANSMLIIQYTSQNDNDESYRSYIRDTLHFINIPISNTNNEIYHISNHEFTPIVMQGGLKNKSKKIFYKRRNSKKKTSKKKSPKKKSSKKKSLKRKSSKRNRK